MGWGDQFDPRRGLERRWKCIIDSGDRDDDGIWDICPKFAPLLSYVELSHGRRQLWSDHVNLLCHLSLYFSSISLLPFICIMILQWVDWTYFNYSFVSFFTLLLLSLIFLLLSISQFLTPKKLLSPFTLVCFPFFIAELLICALKHVMAINAPQVLDHILTLADFSLVIDNNNVYHIS